MQSAALPVHRHALPQLAIDAGLVALAYYFAYRLRFDQGVPDRYQRLLELSIGPTVLAALAVLIFSGVYRRWARWSTQRDYLVIVRSVPLFVVAAVAYVSLIHPYNRTTEDGIVGYSIPAGVVVLFALLSLVALVGVRFAAALVNDRGLRGAFGRRGLRAFRTRKDARSVLIVGAGEGGRLLIREILRNPDLGYAPVGFVDDDRAKRGARLYGGKVHGSTHELGRILDDLAVDEVLIAIPSAPGMVRARVVSECRERGVPVRTLPTVFELLQGAGTVLRQVREVRVEDVLGREPVPMEIAQVGAYLAERVVMVTGAGGSIGSELCRQISRVAPARLVLVDHAEDNLFEIHRELEQDRHFSAEAVLADCKEGERMREVFAEHRPEVVFHAAAYKHVGLMELNPVEAVRNNAIATRVIADVAGESGVDRFVLVSTDKAVAPATVMGASKALAEWVVEAASAGHPRTSFASVRFGNVLGSSGSVVPIFRRQIAAGGPVTVTDPAMMRFFMTIPEAVQLVIRSGALDGAGTAGEAGGRGEVFVLDMGEPVAILDLARQMIRLSGLEPGRDIAIEVIGPRPGEKLTEVLFNSYESAEPTEAPRIMLARRPPIDPAWVRRTFDQINLLVLEGDAAALAEKVSELSALRALPTGPALVPAAAHGGNGAGARNGGAVVPGTFDPPVEVPTASHDTLGASGSGTA